MSVDISIKLSHLPNDKRKSFTIESTIDKVMDKYPLIKKIENGAVYFGNLHKCSASFQDDEIYFSTNAALYDYMGYAAYAFADVLGIGTIFEYQEGKELPINEFSEYLDSVSKQIEAEKELTGYPKVYRLKPKRGKFRLLQLENAIDKINEKYEYEVIVPVEHRTSGLAFSFLDEDRKENLTIIEVNEDLSEIQVVLPSREIERFNNILNQLKNELNAQMEED